MQIMLSNNLGADWLNLSPNQLAREKQDGNWSDAVNIDDMLSTELPTLPYQWTTEGGREWGGMGSNFIFLYFLYQRNIEEIIFICLYD